MIILLVPEDAQLPECMNKIIRRQVSRFSG